MRIVTFLIILSSIGLLRLNAQVERIIYLDYSRQSNQYRLISKSLDTLLRKGEGQQTLLFLSNGAVPVMEFGAQLNYRRIDEMLKRLKPTTPSPYIDIEKIIYFIENNGGLSKSVEISFFLPVDQINQNQQYDQKIMETLLLSMGLIKNKKIVGNQKVNLIINSMGQEISVPYTYINGINTLYL